MGERGMRSPPIETSHPLPVLPRQPLPVTILRGTPKRVSVGARVAGSPFQRPLILRPAGGATDRFLSVLLFISLGFSAARPSRQLP